MTKKKTISQQLAEKTFKQLGYDPKTGKPLSSPKIPPKSSYFSPTKPPFRIKALEKTRRQSPKGRAYQYSALYRNAVILRLLAKKFTDRLNPVKDSNLISQIKSETRSVVANIREGYLRPSSDAYSTFLGFSHGSLEEFRGDVEDAKDDGLLPSRPGSTLADIGILLKPLSEPEGSPSRRPKSSYDPLGEHKRKIKGIRGENLTFEIFIELINKTDYLIKRVVEGLDKKIITDEKKKLNQELSNIRRKNW